MKLLRSRSKSLWWMEFLYVFHSVYSYKQQSIPTTISSQNPPRPQKQLDKDRLSQNNKSKPSNSSSSSAFCCSCLKNNNSFSKFRFSSSSSSFSSSYFSALPSFSPVKLIISALLLTNTALLAESSSILSNTLHHLTLQYPSGSWKYNNDNNAWLLNQYVSFSSETRVLRILCIFRQ